jgi:hypothetical protein
LGLVDAPGTSPGLKQPWAGGRNRFAVKTDGKKSQRNRDHLDEFLRRRSAAEPQPNKLGRESTAQSVHLVRGAMFILNGDVPPTPTP